MRKIETKQKKESWFTPFEDDKETKIKLKPFSILHLTKLPTTGDLGVEQMYNIFNRCVVDWKGIINNKDNKPLPCNSENKTKVFEQDFELASAVVVEAISLKIQVVDEKESKNLSTSQPGQETKQGA